MAMMRLSTWEVVLKAPQNGGRNGCGVQGSLVSLVGGMGKV
jgi:hypothetical protein